MNYWVKGIGRRWKDYRLVMIVTFIAAVFMSGMLLLQNIMNAYIMEQNYQYYGDWIVAARDEPLEHPYLSEHGRLAVAGNEIRDAGGETLASPVLLGSLMRLLPDLAGSLSMKGIFRKTGMRSRQTGGPSKC